MPAPKTPSRTPDPTPVAARRRQGRFPIDRVLARVEETVREFHSPSVSEVAATRDPFKVLISCLISLRTKDAVTAAASERLFAVADTAAALARLTTDRIARLIYPAGFYRTKAERIRDISRRLVEDHGGRVPPSIEALLQLKGVGRKTANLVVTLGFGKPGICVDTHVHRISNRWGYVRTRTPHATEIALRAKLPHEHWIGYNDLLVTFGQYVCTPVSPRCSECAVASDCRRTGVRRSR